MNTKLLLNNKWKSRELPIVALLVVDLLCIQCFLILCMSFLSGCTLHIVKIKTFLSSNRFTAQKSEHSIFIIFIWPKLSQQWSQNMNRIFVWPKVSHKDWTEYLFKPKEHKKIIASYSIGSIISKPFHTSVTSSYSPYTHTLKYNHSTTSLVNPKQHPFCPCFLCPLERWIAVAGWNWLR